MGAGAAAAVLVAACSSSGSSPGTASGQPAATVSGSSSGGQSLAGQAITLYNGQHEQTTDALVQAFEKQTGVTVKVRSDDEDVLAQQIEQEGSRSPADVFFTENTPPLASLDEKGLLAPIDSAALAPVPAKYSASDKDWAGISVRVSVMVYNTNDLKPAQLPKSVLDLADPQWKGKLGIAPGETDFAPIVTSVAQDKGDAAAVTWLEGLKTNAGAHTEPDNETLVSDVNKGIVEIGVINHYYWYRLRDEVGRSGIHSALAEFAPGDDGYLLDVSGAGVLKSSQHKAAAEAFVQFMTSAAGQRILTKSDSWEYPISDGVTNPALPALSSFHPRSFSLTQIGDGSKAVSLLQQAGLL